MMASTQTKVCLGCGGMKDWYLSLADGESLQFPKGVALGRLEKGKEK